ncbi:hypothetical protein R1flu_005965 [Riccia fluitans]|uniref:RING-type domain-containing protein n=1 Tax=Riccia fluitans TaxID=41844 RepID=A0ABD1YUN6_9MARC
MLESKEFGHINRCGQCCCVPRPFHEEFRLVGRATSHSAQHYGLVEGPRPKLSELEWSKVKELSRQRLDSSNPCPICKEKFQIKEKVILSCSHIFHRACLHSFERYSLQQPCCPVCRTRHYEKLVLKNNSSISVRPEFKQLSGVTRQEKSLGPNSVAQRIHRNVEPGLPRRPVRECSYTDPISTGSGGVRSGCIVPPSPPPPTPVDWHLVVNKALERGESECPICIGELVRRGPKQKGLAWLSCSHMFHIECISTFEEFNKSSETCVGNLCPVCRSPYERMDM